MFFMVHCVRPHYLWKYGRHPICDRWE